VLKYNFIIYIIITLTPCYGQTRGVQIIYSNPLKYALIAPQSFKPVLLNEPGNYHFSSGTNVDFITSGTIINITSNNVTINLQNFTLSQKNAGSSNKNITGINIADGLSNITIKNGNINNITGTAIIMGQNCFNITLNNLTIAQARSGGIEVQTGTDTMFINNCFAGKSLTNKKNNFGLSLTSNKNITVHNCSFIGVRAPTGYNAFGITATNCIDCSINNCAINNNSGDTVSGLHLNNCIAFEVDNIETNGNSSSVGGAAGIECSGGQGNTFKNSTSFYNTAATNSRGIYFHSNASYNQVFDCTTSCQKVLTTGNASGICITTGTSNCFTRITSFGNTGGSLTTSKGCGIILSNTYGVIVDHSTCNYNNGGTGKGYGIHLINTSRCIIEENKLYYNHGTAGSWGIQEEENSLSFLASNIAFGNAINYGVTHSTLNSIQQINFKSSRSSLKDNRGNIDVTT
jgi:hypothetical protein